MKAVEQASLIKALKARFQQHPERHRGISWAEVEAKLTSASGRCAALQAMEQTGGDPDVVGYDKKSDTFIFCDCSAESPRGRRSLCYDRAALDSRKEHKPGGTALDMASSLGIELLTEERYRELQRLGEFDLKTSSWVMTPPDVRGLGGALYCDRRFGRVFVYHNGAESYYAARGFRGMLRI